MALLPGLRGSQDPSKITRNSGRKEAAQYADVGRAQLQPQARPVDTYVRPAAAPPTNSALQLAEGLAQIVPSMNRFLAQEAERQQVEAEAKAAEVLAQIPAEELQARVREGQIPEMALPWFKPAFMRLYGVRLGREAALAAAKDYDTGGFDKDSGDVDRWLTERTAADLEALDEDARKGYIAATEQPFLSIRSKHQEYVTGQVVEQRTINVQAGLLTVFDGQVGKTPEEIQAAITQYQDNALQTFPELDKSTWNGVIVESLANWVGGKERLTKQEMDFVNEVLDSERGGVGPVSRVGRFADDSNRIRDLALNKYGAGQFARHRETVTTLEVDARGGRLDSAMVASALEQRIISPEQAQNLEATNLLARERAEAARAEAAQKQLETEETEGFFGQLLGQVAGGDFAYIPASYTIPSSGKVLSQEQIETGVVQRFLESGPSELEKINFFSRSGLVNPEWKQLLENGAMAATPVTLTSATPPEVVTQSLDTFVELYRQAPQMVTSMLGGVNSPRMAYYVGYDTMLQAGYSRQEAMAQLAVLSDPVAVENVRNTKKYRDSRTKAEQEIARGITGGNSNAALNTLQNYVETFTLIGMDGDKAAAEARRIFERNHVKINNWWVETGARTPPDFEPMAKAYLDLQFESLSRSRPELELDRTDLVLQGQGDVKTVAYVLDGRTPIPLMRRTEDGRSVPVTFGPQNFESVRNRNRSVTRPRKTPEQLRAERDARQRREADRIARVTERNRNEQVGPRIR